MKGILNGKLFKIKKEKFYFIIAIVICATYTLMGLPINAEDIGRMGLLEIFLLMQQQQLFMIYIVTFILVCFHIGKAFANKSMLLEIMHGKLRKQVFFSEYIICVPICLLISIFLYLFAIGMVAVIGKVSLQDTDIGALMTVIVLHFIILIRFFCMMISVNFIVRNGVLSGMAIWGITIFQAFPWLIRADYDIPVFNAVGSYSGWLQLALILTEGITAGLIAKIVITAVLECVLLGGIAYWSFQKAELR